MPSTRSRSEKLGNPSYSGRFMVDTIRGAIRVRKWPAKRGSNQPPLVKAQNQWFRDVSQLIKFAPASQVIAAMEATKGTGVYPRDLLMHTVSEGIVDIFNPDGSSIVSHRPWIEGVEFQGARLQTTNPLTINAGILTVLIWEDPVLDTATIWNIAAPSRLTIPAGVTVVNLFGGAAQSTILGGELTLIIRQNGNIRIVHQDVQTGANNAQTIVSGPVPVVGGDFFEMQLFTTVNATYNIGPQTFFSLQIIGTT